MKSKNVSIGILDVVGIVFIVLKLVGTINWSWWWIFAPFWGQLVLLSLILLGAAIWSRWVG